MMLVLMAAAAVVADTPMPPAMPEASVDDARNVVAAQLRSPPRTGRAAGLDAQEADAVLKLYLASIGRKLELGEDEKRR